MHSKNKTFLILSSLFLLAGCGGQNQPSPTTESSSSISYERSDSWTVSFDSQGGSAVASQTVAYGELASKPADPTKEGYTFQGWFKDKAAVTPFVFESTPITANWTLYAGWQVEHSSSTSGSTSTSSSTSSEAKGIIVYFKDAGWWAADGALSSVHYWGEGTNTEWPGVVMTLVGADKPSPAGGNIWKFELDSVDASGGFMFVRHSFDPSAKGNSADWGAKTPDFTLSGRKNGDMYDISSSSATWGTGVEGNWTTYSE